LKKKIRIIDSTMRDGMHALSHQYSIGDIKELSAKLDEAGVEAIEISHGDGLGGSSYQYGFAAHSDAEWLAAAASVIKHAKLTVLLLPGIGTAEDLKIAADHNAKIVRVATHVTEADVGIQHIKMAKNLGMEAIGFLMMAHMASPEKIVEQAKIFADAGADMIYITDSAGHLMPDGVGERILAVRDAIDLPVGFHGHNNMGLAVGNTIKAIECGAVSVDACCKGMGAAAGNTPTEVITAVLDILEYETGIDLYKITDVADDILVPKMRRPIVIDKNSLMIGYAGVYGSFLLHALRAQEKFGVDARDILVEMGRRKTVGGQEDMIINVAYDLKNQAKG
jgi:4-hydroxy 2-oxovalerate aldolase